MKTALDQIKNIEPHFRIISQFGDLEVANNLTATDMSLDSELELTTNVEID